MADTLLVFIVNNLNNPEAEILEND